MGEPTDDDLVRRLEARFAAAPGRHAGLSFAVFAERLAARPPKLAAVAAMELSGGEPDVTGFDATTGEFVVCDCAPESPAGRRSLCYDGAALDARKENKPRGSALDLAAEMGIEILTEAQYRDLQALFPFDRKTSSWIATPPDVRGLGGALFCDRRYERVFVYHNGAESYYAARGFRGRVTV